MSPEQLDEPLSTVVTKARHGVAEPFLVELRGTADSQINAGGMARELAAQDSDNPNDING